MTDVPLSKPAPDPGAAVPAEYDVFCEACGYSLIGITADRCPECGAAYDPAELPFARIPWLHRRRLGTLRAYLATVRMVMFRPRRFARELYRPSRVSADDAATFRRTGVRVAAVSVACTMLGIAVAHGWGGPPSPLGVVRYATVAVALFGYAVGAWIFFALATDMPTFIWRGPPSRPRDALAPVHHYASAPLALQPLCAAATVLGTVAGRLMGVVDVDDVAIPLLLAGLGLTLAAQWAVALVLMRTVSGAGAGRMLALAVCLPLVWALDFLFGMIAGMFLIGIGLALVRLVT